MIGRRIAALAVVTVCWFAPIPARAIDFACSAPTEPVCLSMAAYGSGFDTESEFDWCRFEVERYLSDLREWNACVADEAIRRGDEIVEKFNCVAAGKSWMGTLCM